MGPTCAQGLRIGLQKVNEMGALGFPGDTVVRCSQACDLRVAGGSSGWLGPSSTGSTDAQNRCSGPTCSHVAWESFVFPGAIQMGHLPERRRHTQQGKSHEGPI